MGELTAEERGQIGAAVSDQWSDPAVAVTILHAITPAVDRILAARRESLAERVKALAVQMGGVGSHRDPCRLPDTPCLCGVCDFRAEAAALVRALLDPSETP